MIAAAFSSITEIQPYGRAVVRVRMTAKPKQEYRMSLEPVRLDFVESPYDPSFAGRGASRPNPFPLVGLTQAQFDAVAAWDLQLDDRAGDPHGNEPLEPMEDRPRPQGDPLDREVPRERSGSDRRAEPDRRPSEESRS